MPYADPARRREYNVLYRRKYWDRLKAYYRKYMEAYRAQGRDRTRKNYSPEFNGPWRRVCQRCGAIFETYDLGELFCKACR